VRSRPRPKLPPRTRRSPHTARPDRRTSDRRSRSRSPGEQTSGAPSAPTTVGHFYWAHDRTLLLCVDIAEPLAEPLEGRGCSRTRGGHCCRTRAGVVEPARSAGARTGDCPAPGAGGGVRHDDEPGLMATVKPPAPQYSFLNWGWTHRNSWRLLSTLTSPRIPGLRLQPRLHLPQFRPARLDGLAGLQVSACRRGPQSRPSPHPSGLTRSSSAQVQLLVHVAECLMVKYSLPADDATGTARLRAPVSILRYGAAFTNQSCGMVQHVDPARSPSPFRAGSGRRDARTTGSPGTSG